MDLAPLLNEKLLCVDRNESTIEEGSPRVRDPNMLKIKENIEARKVVMVKKMRDARERKRKAIMSENKIFNGESSSLDMAESTDSKPPLFGVRFTLSGFQNPIRGQLRDKMSTGVMVVTAPWVEKCYIEKKKVDERFFMLS
uniref:BRCT domain-containing protein n=1 Tax=Heterorhabditis bacteriophora TaxID=37862 RepID=A0A1I7WVV9_HETBA